MPSSRCSRLRLLGFRQSSAHGASSAWIWVMRWNWISNLRWAVFERAHKLGELAVW